MYVLISKGFEIIGALDRIPGENGLLIAPWLLIGLLLLSAAGLALVVPLLRQEVLPLLIPGKRDGEAAVAGEDVEVVGGAARGVLRGRGVAAVPTSIALARAETAEVCLLRSPSMRPFQ